MRISTPSAIRPCEEDEDLRGRDGSLHHRPEHCATAAGVFVHDVTNSPRDDDFAFWSPDGWRGNWFSGTDRTAARRDGVGAIGAAAAVARGARRDRGRIG